MTVGAFEFEGLLESHDLMLDLGVTKLARDVVLSDMNLMEERRIAESLHAFREVMARPAPLLLSGPISHHNVRVTL